MVSKNSGMNKVVVYVLLVTYSLIWGFSFVGTTTALKVLSPMQVLAARWTIGMIIIVGLSLVGVLKVNLRGKPVKYMVGLAFVQPILYSITEVYGMDMTTASEAAIIVSMAPLLVLVISTLFLRMKIDGVTKFAIVIAVAGMICTVVFAEDFAIGNGMLGYFILLICVTSSAVFSIMSNKLSDIFTPIERTLMMSVVGSIFFNAFVLIQDGGLGYVKVCVSDAATLGAVLFLGIGCTFIAYIFCNISLSNLPAHVVTTVSGNLITITGVVSGVLVNGDPWGLYTIVGMVMMMVGVVLVNRQ